MTTDSRAGWRTDPYGVERWWDGYKWHEARDRSHDTVARPASTAVAPATSRAPARMSFTEQYPQQQAYAPAPQVVVVASLKEMWIAYVLAIVFGTLGIHRFYLGRTGSAIAMLVIGLVSVPAILLFGVGLLGLLAVAIWWVVDLFLIPGMVREENERRMRSMRWGAGY